MSKNNTSDLWWHNIPTLSVGDLVERRTDQGLGMWTGRLYLVIEAKPVKPCRVNPVQRVRLMRCHDGEVIGWRDTKKMVEVSNEGR